MKGYQSFEHFCNGMKLTLRAMGRVFCWFFFFRWGGGGDSSMMLKVTLGCKKEPRNMTIFGFVFSNFNS